MHVHPDAERSAFTEGGLPHAAAARKRTSKNELGADILLGARDGPWVLQFAKTNTRPRGNTYFRFQTQVAGGRKTGPRAAVHFCQTGDPGACLKSAEGCPL